MIWEGIDPVGEPRIGMDVIVEVFDNKIAAGDYIAQGHDVVNASWYPLYVVKNWVSPASAVAEWNPLLFGKWAPPTPPCKEMKKIAPTPRLRGACICTWEQTEDGEEPSLIGKGQPAPGYGAAEPRLQAAAERMWGSSASAEDLLSRIGKLCH
jgi:hypothetical protein